MSSPPRTQSTSALGPIRLPQFTLELGAFVASQGVEAYLVGGAVRDAVLGRDSTDVDVALAADAPAVARKLASLLGGTFVTLDETRGIARVVVTRGDDTCLVDFNTLHGGIDEDLQRRDFTVDAMAIPLSDGPPSQSRRDLVDPHSGLSDLRDGVIRAVAPSVLEEDPARLIRAPRLSAQLRFEIDGDTKVQIRRRASLVSSVAPERIRDELLKLLAEPRATDSLRLLDELGLLRHIVPELAAADGVTQPKEHQWDVLNHLLETPGKVEAVVSGQSDGAGFGGREIPRFDGLEERFAEEVCDGHTRLTLLKMAALLHDIAKPSTKTVESSGKIRFLGHHTEGAETANGILRRLRFGGRGVELVRLMVLHHLRPSQMAQKGELPTGKAIYRYFRDVGDAAIDTLYLNMADYLAARGDNLGEREWSEHCGLIGHILHEGLYRKAPETLPNLVNGHDIIRVFSLSPGRTVGWLLGLVQEAQAAGEVSTKEEAVELMRHNLDIEAGDA